jgi:hypothetical protein
MAAGGERNERHPEATLAAGLAQRARQRGRRPPPAQLALAARWPCWSLTGPRYEEPQLMSGRGGGYRGTPRAGRRASDRGAPLDAIVNGTSGPRRRAQTRPATASSVPRHVLSRMYYWLSDAT